MARAQGDAIGRPPVPDLLQLAVVVAGISLSSPLIAATGVPVLAIAAWRCLIGAAVTAPFVRVQRPLQPGVLRTTVLSGVVLGAHFATWMSALRYTSVASTVTISATQPIWAAFMAHRSGHVVTRRGWWGIALCVAGVALISGFDVSVSARALLGDSLALAGSVLAAWYVTLGQRARVALSTATYTTIVYAVAGAGLLVLTLALGRPMGGYSGADWGRILALTICAQLLGHTLMSRVLSTTSATVTSLAILLEMPGATLVAALWLHQRLTVWLVPSVILLGVGLVVVITSGGDPVPEPL